DSKIDCDDSDCACPDAGKETDCSNGEDDDNDGKVDCEDSDCSCPTEDCSNGKDDDNDGKADCEDDECVCVPVVPEGWDGPVVIWYGSPDLKPTCSAAGAYRAVVHDLGCELSEPAWECPECQCGAPQDATCSARITYFSAEDCSGRCWPLGSSDCGYDVGSACEAITLNYGGVDDARPLSASVELSAPSGGGCLPEPSVPVEPSGVSWDEVLLACGDAPVGGLGCDAEHTCVPRPPMDPFDRICVYADGGETCPSDYEASRKTAYGDYDDTRGCTECGCTAPTGIQCSGTVTDYNSRQRCGGEETDIGAGECLPIPPQSNGSEDFRHVSFENSTAGGMCTATGGERTGSVERNKEVTFCCRALYLY
ncbi:MAG: hypothetical protein JW940_34585, partial [Polyangiaceae bacterium]|nr:hypothetical protein [Polyangiaceae bacterium]